MNYRVNFDRTYTNITRTNDPADEELVFSKIVAAKRAVRNYVKEEITGFKEALKRTNSLKKDELEIE